MTRQNGSLDGLVSELETLYHHAQDDVYAKTLALENAKRDMNRLKAMLKASGWSDEENPKPQKKPKARTTARYSDETRHKVLLGIRSHVDYGRSAIPGVPGSFTVSDLMATTLEVSDGTIRTVINGLRDEGVVRLAGVVDMGGNGRSPQAYALTGEYPER